MADTNEPTLAQRWASDTGALQVVGQAAHSRQPQGAVRVAAVTDTNTQRVVGLLWTDAAGIGFCPAADGGAAATDALSYAWGVMNASGVNALTDDEAFSPGYRLGDPTRYPSLRAAYQELIR